jgi:hypothetical protein
MQIIIQDLEELIREYRDKLYAIPDSDFYAKPNPAKWSKIEVLGHLIDSAQNNLRRFICGQYESTPPLIVYDQDFWVAANNYQSAKTESIIQLWILLNERIDSILLSMDQGSYDKNCNTGREIPRLRSLEWLAGDYVKHMKHHLNQIIPGSFNIIYPG